MRETAARGSAAAAVGAFRGWALPRGVAWGRGINHGSARDETRSVDDARVRLALVADQARVDDHQRASRVACKARQRAREGGGVLGGHHTQDEAARAAMSSRFAVAKRNLGSIPGGDGWMAPDGYIFAFPGTPDGVERVRGLHPKISPARTTQTRENRFQIIYAKGTISWVKPRSEMPCSDQFGNRSMKASARDPCDVFTRAI